MKNLNAIIKQAIDDIAKNGMTDTAIQYWVSLFKKTALRTAFKHTPASVIEPHLRKLFNKEVTSGKLLKRHGGIAPLKLKSIEPQFRNMLTNRIKANINLIVLERPNSIDVSTARLSGWLMNGVQQDVPLPDVYKNITKPISKQLNYEHRRRAIDQGHKMLAAIDETLAVQGGAIVAVWHAHPPTSYYQSRPDHWKRNKEPFVIRDSWAYKDGLLKKGENGFMEDIPEQPAQAINCTCYYEYLYTIAEVKRKYPHLIKE